MQRHPHGQKQRRNANICKCMPYNKANHYTRDSPYHRTNEIAEPELKREHNSGPLSILNLHPHGSQWLMQGVIR